MLVYNKIFKSKFKVLLNNIWTKIMKTKLIKIKLIIKNNNNNK